MDLLEFINSKTKRVIFFDGAMGTQLAEHGLEMGGQNNVSHPETVLTIHREYADCGIDLLITNTLTMNRVSVESHRVPVDVVEVNLAGARLARAAAHEGQYVLGDIGSTGKLLRPYGPLPEEEARASFREQAALLAQGGVDGFIVETMIDLREAVCAVEAIREVSDLPIIATMAFNTVRNGGRTVMGNTARDCAQALTAAGVCAVGANCGSLDPQEMAEIIAMMGAATSLPLVAQPNAGRGRLVERRLIFDMSPADFVRGLRACVEAGARLVGGCCGTSPAHIRAMVEALSCPHPEAEKSA